MADMERIEKTIRAKLMAKNSSLDLYNCGITGNGQVLKELKDIQQLEKLNLNYNPISNYSFLKDLKQLKNLNLRDNKISDISNLKELEQLQSLDLSCNQISDISDLKGLKQLQNLTLSTNKVLDISSLKELKQLENIDLNFNQISYISLDFINAFPKLKNLHLFDNPIKNIPKDIFDNVGNVLQEVKNYLESIEKKEEANFKIISNSNNHLKIENYESQKQNELLNLIDELEYSTFFIEAKKTANKNPELARLRKRFMHDGGGFEFAEQLKVWVLHNFE